MPTALMPCPVMSTAMTTGSRTRTSMIIGDPGRWPGCVICCARIRMNQPIRSMR